jgi:hypothetical protein
MVKATWSQSNDGIITMTFLSVKLALTLGRANQLKRYHFEAAVHEVEARSERFSDEVKRSILEKRIILGMTPEEARLAGGACFYRVQADPKHWPSDGNPLIIMARQTDYPDDSKITLTFHNATQFQSREPVTFRVEIRRGRVTEIVPVDRT